MALGVLAAIAAAFNQKQKKAALDQATEKYNRLLPTYQRIVNDYQKQKELLDDIAASRADDPGVEQNMPLDGVECQVVLAVGDMAHYKNLSVQGFLQLKNRSKNTYQIVGSEVDFMLFGKEKLSLKKPVADNMVPYAGVSTQSFTLLPGGVITIAYSGLQWKQLLTKSNMQRLDALIAQAAKPRRTRAKFAPINTIVKNCVTANVSLNVLGTTSDGAQVLVHTLDSNVTGYLSWQQRQFRPMEIPYGKIILSTLHLDWIVDDVIAMYNRDHQN